MEITKVVKPFIRRGWPNTFGNIVYRLEIGRYIGLPIFFPIFKHFTIIGYVKKKIGLIFFFHIHNYTEYNQHLGMHRMFGRKYEKNLFRCSAE